MKIWVVVAAAGAGTAVLKAAGPLLLHGRPMSPRAQRMLSLLAPALLSALILVQVLGVEDGIRFDERLLGVGAAIVAAALRAPIWVVVGVAALVTALARLP
ncbi:MAG TPA: AzlD domain-containing protein [Actinomycetota bacterium]